MKLFKTTTLSSDNNRLVSSWIHTKLMFWKLQHCYIKLLYAYFYFSKQIEKIKLLSQLKPWVRFSHVLKILIFLSLNVLIKTWLCLSD